LAFGSLGACGVDTIVQISAAPRGCPTGNAALIARIENLKCRSA
jgi:hypothetical protein